MIKSKTDILLELKEKGNIWVDAHNKRLCGWHKGKKYDVPLCDGLVNWKSTQRGKILFKAPDIRQADFNKIIKEEIDNLVSVIWRNQR